ncbi:MAG TPA: hypothetical protein VJR26_09495 [Candidatus Acidoferrales bacterium]|nr:hypothetical protein [Candidatus Acidoferrales bacterium]
MLDMAIDSTQRAPQPGPRAFLAGAGLVWTRQRILWWIFAVNLVLAFAGASFVAHNVAENSGAALNHSLESARRLVEGFDLSALGELSSLPEQPLRGTRTMFVWPSIFFTLFMIFSTGGILVSYYDDLRLDAAGFFEACGRHFWRFVRLAIYFIIVMIPVVFAGSAVGSLYDNVDDASVSPYSSVAFLAAVTLLFLFVLISIRIWFDMAQIISMAKNDRRMYRMLGRSAKLVWNNFGSLFWLYIRISVVGWVVFAAGLSLWMLVLPPDSTGPAILVGQAMTLFWLGTRLWQHASETEWYKRYRTALYQPVPMPPPPSVPPPIPDVESLPPS